jgi:hypothetical protein
MYVQEIVPFRVSAVENLSPKKQLVAVTTVGTTAVLVAPVTFVLMKKTLTGRERYATDTEPEGQSITASA